MAQETGLSVASPEFAVIQRPPFAHEIQGGQAEEDEMRSTSIMLMAALAATAVLVGSSRAEAACVGDCSGDGEVTVDELIRGVNIALDLAAPASCTAMDGNQDGQVTVAELVLAVNGALNGCPAVATPTPTPTRTEAVASPTPACDESDGTAAVSATSAAPESGRGQLDATCVTAENAGGTRTELTRVSVRGTVNGTAFLLQVYFVTATGAVDTVSYGWAPSPSIPDFFANFAFCNTPACAGASVDLGNKTVRLNGTALTGEGASAVLDGSITLDRIPTPPATTPTPACPGGNVSLVISDIQGSTPGGPPPSTLELGMAMNYSQPANPPALATLSALYDGCPMPFPRLTLGFSFSAAAFEAGGSYSVGDFQGAINQIEFRREGFSAANEWRARSGTLVVDSIVDGDVTFRIVDARMMYQDIGPPRTFLLNGSGRLDAQP